MVLRLFYFENRQGWNAELVKPETGGFGFFVFRTFWSLEIAITAGIDL